MSSRTHLAAIRAALEATALTVYTPDQVEVAETTEGLPSRPYGVLYAELGTPTRTKLCGDSDAHASYTFQVTYVGDTDEQCRWASDEARGALVDVRLSVSGRSAYRVEVVTSQWPRRDDDLPQRPVMFALDVFRLATVSA